MVKLYSYSSELLTFVEAKWAKSKLAAYAILVGTIIFYGFIKLDQSVGDAIGSRSANALVLENKFLRQQINVISPRVSKLEIHAKQLVERDSKLRSLLLRRTVAGDTISDFTYTTKEADIQSSAPVATSFVR